MSEIGDLFKAAKENAQERRKLRIKHEAPLEIERLKKLHGISWVIEGDGAGGDRYVITIPTDRGLRFVEYWYSTNLWKVRGSGASGYGIGKLQRYFKLVYSKLETIE